MLRAECSLSPLINATLVAMVAAAALGEVSVWGLSAA